MPDQDERRCPRCGEIKPETEFYRPAPKNDQARSCHYWCKPCMSAYTRLQKLAHRRASARLRSRFWPEWDRLYTEEKALLGLTHTDPLQRATRTQPLRDHHRPEHATPDADLQR